MRANSWQTTLAVISWALLVVACRERRTEERAREALDFRGEVLPLLHAQCGECHGEARAEAGYRVDDYLAVIGCNREDEPITRADAAGRVRLLAALDAEPHRGLLDPAQRALLERWVEQDAPGHAGVHDAHFMDPRSPAFHGARLRDSRYRPLLDPADADACGTCHVGTPGQAAGVSAAAGAPDCTSCHSQPGGVFACGTCHGEGARAYPPRARCFFPQDLPGSHAAHVESSPSAPGGLACSGCHPVPEGMGDFAGAHSDGTVEVWFAGVWDRTRFDASSKQCTGSCHAGAASAQPVPSWGGAPIRCGGCHSAPPANHYAGACSTCHGEVDAAGEHVLAAGLHLNGAVDVGDGRGGCGSCHGDGDSPWPNTGAHAAHAAPALAAKIACETCHVVPSDLRAHPKGGAAIVRFSGVARTSGRNPVYDAVSKSCSDTYCHDGRGGAAVAPRWTDVGVASDCGACHASPPPAPHVQVASCGGGGCHEGSTTSGPALTPGGILQHVDGRITRGL